MRSRSVLLFTALAALTLFLFLLDLAVGAVAVPLGDVWAALTGGDCPRATAKIILNIRLIKAVVALLAGAALSVSGLQMQTLFRNPLALRARHQFGREPRRGTRRTCRCRLVDRHRWGGMARSGNRVGCHRRRRTPHQGYHGNSDSRHDVLVGNRCGRPNIAVCCQR